MFTLKPLSPGEVTEVCPSSLVTDLAKTLTNFRYKQSYFFNNKSLESNRKKTLADTVYEDFHNCVWFRSASSVKAGFTGLWNSSSFTSKIFILLHLVFFPDLKLFPFFLTLL